MSGDATATVAVMRGPDDARQVIAEHLRSDAGGRCLGCGQLEPCANRTAGHVVLFTHGRQLPRRRPMTLIGVRGDFSAADSSPFDAFGSAA
ncbi:hypothetical protein HDA40_005457 [Hamadaea flava]|uniref:Uncharacterized protein n=1 Tax=Hamadaea flava TaxID=1742688 RepID=A0ABV8LZN2_9ACTN|nr:hypothetical protein [Hamadaea flava]MCP2326950.1 hypothetical protein [Hamadaea flava]